MDFHWLCQILASSLAAHEHLRCVFPIIHLAPTPTLICSYKLISKRPEHQGTDLQTCESCNARVTAVLANKYPFRSISRAPPVRPHLRWTSVVPSYIISHLNSAHTSFPFARLHATSWSHDQNQMNKRKDVLNIFQVGNVWVDVLVRVVHTSFQHLNFPRPAPPVPRSAWVHLVLAPCCKLKSAATVTKKEKRGNEPAGVAVPSSTSNHTRAVSPLVCPRLCNHCYIQRSETPNVQVEK
jgi:hypothetical protein